MKKALNYLRSPRFNSPIARRVGLVFTFVLLGSVMFKGYRLAHDITVALDKITTIIPLPG